VFLFAVGSLSVEEGLRVLKFSSSCFLSLSRCSKALASAENAENPECAESTEKRQES
jgi:hypothetical protein